MRNKSFKELSDYVSDINDLLEAKKLLDHILQYYNIYSGQFEQVPDYDAEYVYTRNDGSYIVDTLNRRIRDYIEFEDSE
jgi:hypothetical protein